MIRTQIFCLLFSFFLYEPLFLQAQISAWCSANGCNYTSHFEIKTNLFLECGLNTPNPNYFVPSSYTTASSIGLGISMAGDVIVIDNNATLYIDQDVMLFNTTVLLGKDAKIIVEGDKTLSILSSTLKGCNYQWDGIYQMIGSTLILDKVNTIDNTIEDAVNGIVIGSSTSRLFASNTQFYSNQNSIKLLYYEPGSATDYNIENCYFSMKHPMLPVSDLHTAYNNPVTGIYIEQSRGIQIPNPNVKTAANTFDNINCGIFQHNAEVEILENTFFAIKNFEQNNTALSAYDRRLLGSAIYAEGSLDKYHGSLLVKTKDTEPKDNSTICFNGCATGITANGVEFTALNNRMADVKNGINSFNCLNKVAIKNNFITNTDFGITLNNNIGAGTVVAQNILFVTDPIDSAYMQNGEPIGIKQVSRYGIYQGEISIDNPVNASIHGNQIWNGRTSIWLNNVNGTQLLFNDLHQTSTVPVTGQQAGLYASNCTDLIIEANLVDGNGSIFADVIDGLVPWQSAYRKCGIRFYHTQNSELCSNIVGGTTSTTGIGYGLAMLSECTGVDIHNNTMNQSKFGLTMRSSGSNQIISSQGDDISGTAHSHGNRFVGPFNNNYTPFGNANCRTASFVNQKPAQIATNGIYTPPKFIYNPANATLESTDPSGAIYNNVANANMVILSTPINPNSTIETLQCDPFQTSFNDWWQLKVARGQAGKNMEEGFEEVGKWLSEKSLYRTLKQDAILRNSHTDLQTFYTQKQEGELGKISEYETKLLALSDSATLSDTTVYKQKLQEAKDYKELIPDNDLQTQNYKTVNTIYLAAFTQAKRELNNEQTKWLQQLAEQCPYLAGDAVYAARTILSQSERTWFYDDADICAQQGVYKTDATEKPKASTTTTLASQDSYVFVFPNPVQTELKVNYQLQSDGMLEFTNALGQSSTSFTLKAGGKGLVIDVSNFALGLYSYRVIENGLTISNGKISIVR